MKYPRSTFRDLAVAAILGCGTLAVWLFVGGLAASIAVQHRKSEITESLAVTKKGDVIVSQYHPDGSFNTYRTIDGQPFTDSQQAEGNYGAWLYLAHLYKKQATLSWQERVLGFSNSDVPPNLWYLVHDGKQKGGTISWDITARRSNLADISAPKAFASTFLLRTNSFP